MVKLGKIPPRSMSSFGVSGLLAPECSVFYVSLFSTKHVGRVSDLLAARLAKSGVDELKLRMSVVLNLFDAYRTHLSGATWTAETSQPLKEPVVVECGIDAEKVAISVAFSYGEDAPVNVEGMQQRLGEGRPEGGFEALAAWIQGACDQLVVKVQPGARRAELVALVALPDAAPGEGVVLEPVVAVLEEAEQAPEAGQYVEMGDLDYPRLLQETLGSFKEGPRSGEIFANIAAKTEEDEALARAIRARKAEADLAETRIGGVTQRITEARTVVRGTPAARGSEEKIVVQGSGVPEAGDLKVVFKGIGGAKPDDTVIKIGGGAQQPVQIAPTMADRQVEFYKEKMKLLLRRIAQLQKEQEEWKTKVTASPAAAQAEPVEEAEAVEGEEAPEAGSGIAKLFKKVRLWPFGKGAEEEAPAAPAEAPPEAAEETEMPPEAEPVEAEPAKVGMPAFAPSTVNLASDSQSLSVEIATGRLNKTIERAQQELGALKKEMASAKARKWADGLVSDLATEKTRLHDLAQNLTQSVRLKEVEFENKERLYLEEIRRRDDMLHHKNTALARVKDQLAHVQMNMERMKSRTGIATDTIAKKQLMVLQGQLTNAKREKMELERKVIDLNRKLNSVKFVSGGKGTVIVESIEMKDRYERSLKQIEEFKKMNRQLMDHIAELNKKKATTGKASLMVEEMRTKLQQAVKVASQNKKEAERYRDEAVRMEQEVATLRKQVAILRSALKATGRSEPGGGSSAA